MNIKCLIIIPLLLPMAWKTQAQVSAEKTVETITNTIQGIGLSTAEMDFLWKKQALRSQLDSTMGFRDEVKEVVGQNGLESVTYYFDRDDAMPLYEIIMEFKDEELRAAVAEKLLGPPNHPSEPNKWILGAQNGVVSLGWAFQNKLVIAASLPKVEWAGDPQFEIPPGFELYQHLPSASEWAKEDMDRFVQSLGVQIGAAAKDFSEIKGEEADGFSPCNAPLAGAENANVLQDDAKRWVVSNTMVSGANGENAILWMLDLENMFDKLTTEKFKLTRVKSQPGFGTTVDLWEVSELSGKQAGVQVGVIKYEWGAEGLWNIDVLVIKK